MLGGKGVKAHLKSKVSIKEKASASSDTLDEILTIAGKGFEERKQGIGKQEHWKKNIPS